MICNCTFNKLHNCGHFGVNGLRIAIPMHTDTQRGEEMMKGIKRHHSHTQKRLDGSAEYQMLFHMSFTTMIEEAYDELISTWGEDVRPWQIPRLLMARHEQGLGDGVCFVARYTASDSTWKFEDPVFRRENSRSEARKSLLSELLHEDVWDFSMPDRTRVNGEMDKLLTEYCNKLYAETELGETTSSKLHSAYSGLYKPF